MTVTSSTVLGPALVGVILNVMLHGVMGLQCCHYFNYAAPSCNDTKWMRTFIGVLLLAETVSTVFDIVWIYDTLIHHFMDASVLTAANWIFATDPAMVAIISTIVQIFFSWRILIVTRNSWIVWFIRLMSISSMCGGLGTAIAIHFVPDFLQFHRFKVIMIIWLVSAVICDTTIAAALSSNLLRRRTGIPQTDQIIRKVTILTISNGLLVTIIAIANLIAFLATPSALYLAFNFPLAKLYSNSLMSTLNQRQAARLAVTVGSRPSQKTNQHSNSSGRTQNVADNSRPMVFVHVESHEMVDPEAKQDIEWSASTTPTGSEKAPVDCIDL